MCDENGSRHVLASGVPNGGSFLFACRILPIAKKHGVPVTFRAAGTSLSGQAITDSVLLKISHTGKNFRGYEVHGDGSEITVEPGLIGGEVNRILGKSPRVPLFFTPLRATDGQIISSWSLFGNSQLATPRRTTSPSSTRSDPTRRRSTAA